MEASASFRFLALNEEQAQEFSLLIPSAELGDHHETGKRVASVKLLDSSLVVLIDEFRRKHSFLAVDCDVFISIASEKRDEVWRAPKTVNYIINIINCPIVFSYTC
jgi:hypothetical protein